MLHPHHLCSISCSHTVLHKKFLTGLDHCNPGRFEVCRIHTSSSCNALPTDAITSGAPSNTLTESEALHAAVAQAALHTATATATAASPQLAVASAASPAAAASSAQQEAVAAALPAAAAAAAACPASDSDEPMAAVSAPATDTQPQQHAAPAQQHPLAAPTETPHGLGIPPTPEEDDFIAMLSEVGQSSLASNTPPAPPARSVFDRFCGW